jgi:Tol biopolymer transport system component
MPTPIARVLTRWALVTVAACISSDAAPDAPSVSSHSTDGEQSCVLAVGASAVPIPPGILAYSVGEVPDVHVLTADGDDRRVTSGPAKEFDPDVSPDGSMIAYRVNRDPDIDAADIWVSRIDGTDQRNLTRRGAANNWSPAWSPDGSRIAFASGDLAAPAVWTMRSDGGDPRRVTDGPGEYPDWSPDGRSIVYAAAPGGGSYDIFVVDANGGASRRLTDTAGTDFAPAWSPSGDWIAFQSERAGEWGIWLTRPDGSAQCELATPGAFAAWVSTDEIAYQGTGGIIATSIATGRSRTLVSTPGAQFPSWAAIPGDDRE